MKTCPDNPTVPGAAPIPETDVCGGAMTTPQETRDQQPTEWCGHPVDRSDPSSHGPSPPSSPMVRPPPSPRGQTHPMVRPCPVRPWDGSAQGPWADPSASSHGPSPSSPNMVRRAVNTQMADPSHGPPLSCPPMGWVCHPPVPVDTDSPVRPCSHGRYG